MEKKTKVDLLAIQLSSIIGKKNENIEKTKILLEESLSNFNADFVFLPEVWTSGWHCPSFPECAENIELAQSISMLKEVAKKYKTNIIGGSIIEKKLTGKLTNTCPVINRDGELVCTYEKNHLYSYYGCAEGDYIKAGASPVMVTLDGINIGLSICYDIRFPELYRAYRKAGADIMVNMAAWGANKKIPWDSMTTSRAVENQTYFVALTQTGKVIGDSNLGHSMIISYDGEILSEINKIEGGFYSTIDLSEMYEFREKCTILNDIKESYEVVLK